MIHTKVTLANQSLINLAHTSRISSLEEDSEEARILSYLIDDAIEYTLRKYRWPFATKTAPLLLLSEDPRPGFGLTYKYPDDCANFHGFSTGQKFNDINTEAEFQVGLGNTSSVIYCDIDQAIGIWTAKVTNPNRWPVDFRAAASFRLSAMAAPGILKGNVGQLADLMDKRFKDSIIDAANTSLNEGSFGRRLPSESQRARW